MYALYTYSGVHIHCIHTYTKSPPALVPHWPGVSFPHRAMSKSHRSARQRSVDGGGQVEMALPWFGWSGAAATGGRSALAPKANWPPIASPDSVPMVELHNAVLPTHQRWPQCSHKIKPCPASRLAFALALALFAPIVVSGRPFVYQFLCRFFLPALLFTR